MKENIIVPIHKFMEGSQKSIFDNARKFVQIQEPNFAYLDSGETAQVIAILTDPECFKSNRMQQVKTQVENLEKKATAQIEVEIAEAKRTVAALQDRLCGMAEFSALTSEQQEQIVRSFSDFNSTLEQQKLIAVIRDNLRRFEENEYQQLLALLSAPQKPEASPGGQTKKNHCQIISIHSLKVPFKAAWLADEENVERYLEAMRETLLEEIRKGKRIQI